MGSLTVQDFLKKHVRHDDIKGKSIIEVGSLEVNYSVRSIFEFYSPAVYKGVDIVHGAGVDQICNAEDLLTNFGSEAFDILVSTEVLEHIKDWRIVISNFKNIIKPGGILFISTRSHGFDYHGYPYDFWRYQQEDMRVIFSEFIINTLEKDPGGPGLFLKATKPKKFQEADLSHLRLYSIVSRRRIKTASLLESILVRTVFPAMLLLKAALRIILPRSIRAIVRRTILEKIP